MKNWIKIIIIIGGIGGIGGIAYLSYLFGITFPLPPNPIGV